MSDALTRVSIVLPVGPDDRAWPPLLSALLTQASAAEILPVFAQHDVQIAPERTLRSAAGRAIQQNTGAEHATREWLWFLHADTQLGIHTLSALRAFVERETSALGWFRLRFADDGPSTMQWNAAGANWRARRLGLPFGDQGLLLSRRDFMRIGCFDTTLRSGEDHALVWRARRAQIPLREIDAELITSARRYADHGWLRTTARHLRMTATQAWQASRR